MAIATAKKIREEMYSSALLENTAELSRTEIAIRHTGDVDNVQVAVEKSLAEGVSGVIRIMLSLILLSVISLPACIVMVIATIVFLALRFLISRRLFQLDQMRLAQLSLVATSVDKAIISAQPLNGLSLIQWVQSRFDDRLVKLSKTAHHVGVLAARMHTGAHTAGLLALFVVVVIAVGPSAESIGAIAASRLYIEGVVRGLESLPGWVRSVQLAGASIARIQQILDWKEMDAITVDDEDLLNVESIPMGVTRVVMATTCDIELFLERVALDLGTESFLVPAQVEPFPSLVEVIGTQIKFPLGRVNATLVGFRQGPDAQGIGAPGLHLHGLTKSKGAGGHVLSCVTGPRVLLEVQKTQGVRVYTP